MKYLIILACSLVLITGCSKQSDQIIQKCNYACLLSDKYTQDSVFVIRDTLWKDECLVDYWWGVVKKQSDSLEQAGMFRHCSPFVVNGQTISLERMFYLLNKKNSPPIIFK